MRNFITRLSAVAVVGAAFFIASSDSQACSLSPSLTMQRLRENHKLATVLAHRGSWGSYLGGNGHPEDSWSAISQANANCIDGVEIDVKSTSDNVPVVMHDFNLGRTTDVYRVAAGGKYSSYTNVGANPLVSSLPWSTVRTLHLLTNNRSQVLTETVPSVEQVIENWILGRHRTIMVFDVKSASTAQQVARIAHYINRDRRVIDPYTGKQIYTGSFMAMKLNATIFPTFTDYQNSMIQVAESAFVITPIPVYTPNMLTKINAYASLNSWNIPSSAAVEIDVKNYNGLMQGLMEKAKAYGLNVGVFNAIPDENRYRGTFFKANGSCCYTLKDLLVVDSKLKDTEDLRGDWEYIKNQGFRTITSDDALSLQNWLQARGLH